MGGSREPTVGFVVDREHGGHSAVHPSDLVPRRNVLDLLVGRSRAGVRKVTHELLLHLRRLALHGRAAHQTKQKKKKRELAPHENTPWDYGCADTSTAS